MARSKQDTPLHGAAARSRVRQNSQSLTVSRNGIRSGADFANFMSALITDIISGSVNPVVANAACNAGGKLLKVVEMEHKYGAEGTAKKTASLVLAPGIAESVGLEA